MTHRSALQIEALHKLLEAGIQSGEVRPLPLTTFAKAHAVDAFRHMATGETYTPLGSATGLARTIRCLNCSPYRAVEPVPSSRQHAGTHIGKCLIALEPGSEEAVSSNCIGSKSSKAQLPFSEVAVAKQPKPTETRLTFTCR